MAEGKKSEGAQKFWDRCLRMAESKSEGAQKFWDPRDAHSFNFSSFKNELRSIKSIPERAQDVQKQRLEVKEFYKELQESGGMYTVQVKCTDKPNEIVTEISNSDSLWKTQRKIRDVQRLFEEDGLILRLTCGCIVPPSKDMDFFPFTTPNGYRLHRRPYVQFCDSESCQNRALVSKEMNIVVTCDRAQVTTTFWHRMESKIKHNMQLKAPNVYANMCLIHFKENYKIDCPKCAHIFVDEFRDDVKKKKDKLSL